MLQVLLRECPELEAALDCHTVAARVEIYRQGQPMEDVHFPTRGVVSVLVRLSDGNTADVLTVGNEGFIGLPAFLGLHKSTDTVMQQASGEMIRIPVQHFRAAIQRSERVRRLLSNYTAYSLRSASQTCVCNVHHTVQRRLCRWLLTSADRADSNDLALTQAMLSEMIGVRRQSVSEELSELRANGTIEQRRNGVLILDRARLEGYACECYEETRALYAELVEPLL
jgi:CRP-like cAMP-binding protein